MSLTLVGSDTVPVPFKITFPDKSFAFINVAPGDTTVALDAVMISNTPSPHENLSVQNGQGSGEAGIAGAASSTDNAITRWNGTGGEDLQNSAAFVDDNGNVYAPNVAGGFTTTATAAGTTTLTVASKGTQAFTGATTQTVVLPVVTTLPQVGFAFKIINNSSGALTINSSGSNLVQTMPANTRAVITCILLTGTSAASWAVEFTNGTSTAGVQTLTTPILGTPTSGTLTNCTGLPATGVASLTATAAELNQLNDVSVYQESVVAAGAMSVTKVYTGLAVVGGGAVTLAAPSATMLGQQKLIEMTTDDGDVTFALTNVVGQSSGTTATFNSAGDALVLLAAFDKWIVLKELGIALA
jgi:hypothetical protein